MKRYCLWIAGCLLVVTMARFAMSAEVATPDAANFEQHVRPILRAHCFHCHGEAGEREGGLDLRLRRWIVAGGESGPAIQVGNPAESLLLERVRSGEMPPGEDKQLTDEQMQVLEQWIAAGAPTLRPEEEVAADGPLFTEEERTYWAFQTIRRPDTPQVTQFDQVRTPIDAFILHQLHTEAQQASADPAAERLSAEADRRVLARRAYFDLLGWLPTPAEVEAFVADESPDAYERLIDRLLASPHYGERWGRHWLDVAGYADSEGYTAEDTVRDNAYRYRDYVIRAWNADKPLDQFLCEQLAGDELVPLPHTNLSAEAVEKLTATGFLRMAANGTGNSGIELTAASNQVVSDTLQIVGGGLLGMTVHCAQCHDHRYDPIPQVDYYRLRAIFEPALSPQYWKAPRARQLSLYSDEDREQAARIEAEAALIDAQRQKKVDEFIQRTLEEQLAEVPADVREALRSAFNTKSDARSSEQQMLLKTYPAVENIDPGSLYLYDGIRQQRVARLDAERKQKTERYVARVIEQEMAQAPADKRAALRAASQAAVEQRTPEQQMLLGEFPGVLATGETLAQFDAAAAAEIDTDKKLADELRAFQAAEELKRLASVAAEVRARKTPEHFLRVLAETPGQIPPTRVFFRGDIQQPKDEVGPGDLSILAAARHTGITDTDLPADDSLLPTSGRRLAFARHLTSRQHPLTARVLANRIWLHHFGRGIVNTPADFGILGEAPTHPALLDWLATELLENGWSAKHLHRLIMTSSVYRQQSVRRPELEAFDPENRLYGRGSLRRLESETLRDALLGLGGQLRYKLYGEPVPVMEDDVGQIVIGRENLDGERKPTDAIELGGEEYRRSIYIQVRRSRPLSILETFDAPAMDPHCTRRTESTVALQSLMFMNNQFVVDQSVQIAKRASEEGGPATTDRIRGLWRRVLLRPPTDAELSAAATLVENQQQVFKSQQPETTAETLAELALGTLCQALVSSNEFLYVD